MVPSAPVENRCQKGDHPSNACYNCKYIHIYTDKSDPKMRAINNILAASASLLLSQVHARIGGISVPSTIKAGDTFNLIIKGTDYIQTVTDISLAVGYFPGAAPPGGDGLGIFITAYDLGQPPAPALRKKKSCH